MWKYITVAAALAATPAQAQVALERSLTFSSDSESKTYSGAIGQSPTAAIPCLAGRRFAFGLIEWTDDSERCELYALARIAEQAAAQAKTPEMAVFFMTRANQWYELAR